MSFNERLQELVEKKNQNSPQTPVYCVEIYGKKIWVKHRPSSKKNKWHPIQTRLSKWFCLPIFACTTSTGGANSLYNEARRLHLFKRQGIPVPNVLRVTADFLATSEVGIPLHTYIEGLDNRRLIENLLFKAVKALSLLHQKSLCHGRPSSRDLTVFEQEIYFIDLEEAPEEVMSLAEAQARDIWLLLNNLSRYCLEPPILINLGRAYLQDCSPDVARALQKMVQILRPIRILAKYTLMPFAGRDLICAINANTALEQAFKPDQS